MRVGVLERTYFWKTKAPRTMPADGIDTLSEMRGISILFWAWLMLIGVPNSSLQSLKSFRVISVMIVCIFSSVIPSC